MNRTTLIPLSLALAAAAQAHFLFILPSAGEDSAEMILSETLFSEDTVNPAIAAGTRLRLRDSEGAVKDLSLTQEGKRFVMALSGRGDRVIYGNANLGVAQRGRDSRPHVLLYYPKAILGNAFAPAATVGGDQVVELVPKGEPGRVRVQFLARGNPVPNTEVLVILPDGQQQKAKTDGDGMAGPFAQHGRYGAWARFWEDKAGEQDGKRYEQQRHYAMIVFDSLARPETAVPLPEKTSSFGAAVESGWLYVYGGHVARTHSYSTSAVSGRFSRRKLEGGAWEELPGATPLQGLNLAAYSGKVCRIGGMQPRNAPGAKSDNHSVAEASCFAAASGTWEALPPLPVPRSSHDVAVVGDQMIVTGGWTMRGAEAPLWAKTSLLLDLRNPAAGWREVPQPFERRALVTAVWHGRVYVIGGITPSGKVSTAVDVYDPASNVWTKAPALPGSDMNGFAPAAAVVGSKLYASTGDGSLFVLDPDAAQWQRMGRSTQRLAHRMVPSQQTLLILGGAVKGGNLDLSEQLTIQ